MFKSLLQIFINAIINKFLFEIWNLSPHVTTFVLFRDLILKSNASVKLI